MAARIGAHFTVCHALQPGDDWERCIAPLQASGPLVVHIGGVRNWGTPAEGIYLSVVDVEDSVARTRRRLSLSDPAGVEYAPHVTLTHPRTTPPDVAAAAWAELEGWSLDAIVSINALDEIEYDGLAWRTVRKVSLALASPADE